jgi:kinesin family protein 18/19
VFNHESNNKQIYLNATKQLVKVVLNGYNATIFAYGVTGAGKTHTMIGYENEPGLMFYTINEIFDGMRALNQTSNES